MQGSSEPSGVFDPLCPCKMGLSRAGLSWSLMEEKM